MNSSSTSNSTGLTPPPLTITPTDRGAIILIVSSMGMVFVFISYFIRLYVRHNITGSWGLDDHVMTAAVAFCVIFTVLQMVEVGHGLGKASDLLDPDMFVSIAKLVYSDQLIYLITLYLSKLSATILILRLTPDKNHVKACRVVILASTAFLIASFFTIAIRCDMSAPWLDEDTYQCGSLFLRWQIVAAFDIISEVAIIAVSIFLVFDLQMSLKLKIFVVVAFFSRAPVIAFIGLRLHYLNIAFHSEDLNLDITLAAIFTALQVDYILVACTVPCLKPFMLACNTGWGNQAQHTVDTVLNDSYRLSSMRGPQSMKSNVRVTTHISILSQPNKEDGPEKLKAGRIGKRDNADSIASDSSEKRFVQSKLESSNA